MDKQIGIRMSNELVLKLSLLAKQNGQTLSQFIRWHMSKLVEDKKR